MALSWDLTGIADFEEECYEFSDKPPKTEQPSFFRSGWHQDPENPERWMRLKPVTEALIWAALYIDIGEITGDNMDSVHARIHAYESIFGSFLTSDGEPRYISMLDLVCHEGLSTNVTTKTDKEWFGTRLPEMMKTLVEQEARNA